MTIKDIAARCGVSVTTVSRVLNHHPYVKEELRQRVLKVIEEEHFIPHAEAVNLVRPQENAIGVVVRGMDNPFFGEMLPLLENAITEAGYVFSLREIHSSDDELQAAASLVKSRSLKGVILLGGRCDYTPEEIAPISAPFICCTFTNTSGALPAETYSSVCVDDSAVAEKAASYLIGLGHTRIAVLAAALTENSISELRFTGYRRALEQACLPFDTSLLLNSGSFRMADAYQTVRGAIENGVRFTALFAISDAMAVAAMKAVTHCGLRVPEDISVMGIDGMELTTYITPTLTTVVQPKEEIAHETVRILSDIIEQRSGPAHLVIQPQLRRGESVGSITL